jgi:hypothetical protein
MSEHFVSVPQPPRFACQRFLIVLAIFLDEVGGLALRDPIGPGEEFNLKSPFDFVPTLMLMGTCALIFFHEICLDQLPVCAVN